MLFNGIKILLGQLRNLTHIEKQLSFKNIIHRKMPTNYKCFQLNFIIIKCVI